MTLSMSVGGLTASIATHLRDPLRRNSYALILGTGLTSGLGLVFWALAARWLPASTVGIGAALVSAIALLANLATLGLRNSLVRFLPSAGTASRRLILSSYAVCAVAAGVVAGVFLLGQPLWAARLAFLRDSPLTVGAFIVGTAVWVIFVLQDQVLIGLRRTTWIPLENGLCSIAKIAILPLLAFASAWAIFAATIIPAVIAVVVITALVLHYAKSAEPVEGEDPVTLPVLVRFAAADHAAALLTLGTADILTLMVLAHSGAEASAYYFMAAMIGNTLFIVISNVGSVLVAEGARYPHRSVALARQALVHGARLVVPLAFVGILLAPWALGILGADYATYATDNLRLVLLAAIPQLIIGISVSTARHRRDLRTIVVAYALIAVGCLGGSWIGLQQLGLVGVSLACLIAYVVVALLLLITGRTGLWPRHQGLRGAYAALGQIPLALRRRRSRRAAGRLLRPALDALGLSADPERARLLTSDFDTLVVALDEPSPLIVKIATSDEAARGVTAHRERLDGLHRLLDGHPIARVIPAVRHAGVVNGRPVIAETQLSGTAAAATPDSAVTAAATTAVQALHGATACRRTLDEDLLAAWIDQPLAQLRAVPSLPAAGLDAIGGHLREALGGVEVTAAHVHGDFWPGNVLVVDAADGSVVGGLVDWENARPVGLPDGDLVHWWLAVQPGELGATVKAALTDPQAAQAAVSRDLPPLPNSQLALEDVILLTWLGHVADGLRRSSTNALGAVWMSRNVKPIVHLFDPAVSRRVEKVRR